MKRRAYEFEKWAHPITFQLRCTKVGVCYSRFLLCSVSELDLFSLWPYLSSAGVLQLQVLLHKYLVDFIQDDIHAVTSHQSQVPVTLRREFCKQPAS